MGPYAFCLALGATGLAAMALLGFGHHGGASSHHVGHHGGHDSGHAGGHHAGHEHAGHHGGHEHGGAIGRLAALFSPRLIFSFLVGLGATGLLVRPLLVEPLTLGAALLGGFGFERFLVRPLWNFLFRFESQPAALLESAILEEAQAVADFDAAGQGLIQLELDGQVLQLLGTLTREERAAARRVRRGDLLRIEEVDPARNRCTVSFAGTRPPGELS
jgi:hypothetical protein